MNKLLLFILFTPFTYFSQNCNCVSSATNNKNDLTTTTGIVISKEFCSLLIQKEFKKNAANDTIQYKLGLIAATRRTLADSVLTLKKKYILVLADSSTITIEGVTAVNNPLGTCCSVGLSANLTIEQIKEIEKHPITKITAFEFIVANFKTKTQKEQQKIIYCLTK